MWCDTVWIRLLRSSPDSFILCSDPGTLETGLPLCSVCCTLILLVKKLPICYPPICTPTQGLSEGAGSEERSLSTVIFITVEWTIQPRYIGRYWAAKGKLLISPSALPLVERWDWKEKVVIWGIGRFRSATVRTVNIKPADMRTLQLCLRPFCV